MIDERHYEFEMNESEKQEFIAAVSIKVGYEEAEAFVDKYNSDDNGYSAEEQTDTLAGSWTEAQTKRPTDRLTVGSTDSHPCIRASMHM